MPKLPSTRRRMLTAATVAYLLCGVVFLVIVQMRPYGVVRTMDIFDPAVPWGYRGWAALWSAATVAFWPLFLAVDIEWR